MMARGRAASIIGMSIDVTDGTVSVDVEGDRGLGVGVGGPVFLSDEEGLAGGASALAFKVDVANGVRGSGPVTGDDGSRAALALGAGERANVERGIFLGIGGVGGHLDDGRVGGPDSNGGVDSLDEDVISGGGGEVGDLDRVGGQGEGGDHSGAGHLVVKSIQVEVEPGWIGPEGADVDNVVFAVIIETNGGWWLRIGLGGRDRS